MRREFSSGGVVFKVHQNSVFWLITRSSPNELYPKTYWRLPKGWLDDMSDGKTPGPLASGQRRATREQLEEAALREVEEEGGVEARITDKIGTNYYTFTFQGDRIQKFVTYFLMKYKKDREEGFGFETAETRWVSYEEAYSLLKNASEKEILQKARNLFEEKGRGGV